MFQTKTLLILNVIYVKLFTCLANVLHAVGKCQKQFKNKLFFHTMLYKNIVNHHKYGLVFFRKGASPFYFDA